jgi:DNA repair protein RadC
MSTNEVITPTANQSVSTSMMEAIQSVTRQGARALRNYNQPQELKLISLRECPTPDMAANYWRANVVTNPYFNPECETLAVLMLNTRRRVKGHCVVSIGTMDTILVHPREVFRLAVIASAHAIIVMHNHPSGEPTPSEADIRITRDLIRAGQLLKVEVLDHVIVGHGKHASLRELGYFYS